MARNIHDQTCTLYRTKYCDMLNMAGCDACTFRANEEGQAQVKKDLDVLEGLLPEGGVSQLFLSEECQLCKEEPRGARACYALIDMAHAEPRRSKRNVVGMKVKAQVGSLLPVQIACCAACRRRLRILEYLPVLLPLGGAVLALAALSVPAVGDALRGVGSYLPAAVFAFVTLLGFALGRALRGRLGRAYAQQMHIDPLELPLLREMRARGWFPLTQDKKGVVKPVFLKKRLAQGVGTGGPEDAAGRPDAPGGENAATEQEKV